MKLKDITSQNFESSSFKKSQPYFFNIIVYKLHSKYPNVQRSKTKFYEFYGSVPKKSMDHVRLQKVEHTHS